MFWGKMNLYGFLPNTIQKDVKVLLNASQQQAVHHLHGPLLILAGAGSGKTTVLMERIQWLIQQGIPASQLLGVTFTQKAAKEMQTRIRAKMGKEMAKDIPLYTFHALCVYILRAQGDNHLKWQADFTIMEELESRQLVKEVIAKEMGLDSKEYPAKEVHAFLSLCKNELVDPHSLQSRTPSHPLMDWERVQTSLDEKMPPSKQPVIGEIYARYIERCVAQNRMDLDDVIYQVVFLLHNQFEVLLHYQHKFHYIMVDEYQDTNRAQYILLRLLASKYRNLVVVGDDFQSIYAFRGSDIRNILQFDEDYAEAKVIKLEENYRCGPYVLAAANQLITHNAFQKEKTLFTMKEKGNRLGYYVAQNEQDEARFVLTKMKEQLALGKSYSDFAVLFRTNQQATILEEQCRLERIPFHNTNAPLLLDRPEVRTVRCYLSLMDNDSRISDFQHICSYPQRLVDNTTLHLLLQTANGSSVREAYREIKAKISTSEQVALTGLFSLLDEWKEKRPYMTASAWLSHFLLESNLLHLQEETEAKGVFSSLTELITLAHRMERKGVGHTIMEFFPYLHACHQIEVERRANAVQLMTLHSAKGLEFPVVFLVGMEEGIFPHAKSSVGFSLEEERRLCYVGVTRAKESLFVSHAKERTVWGKVKKTIPSRFLSEFGKDVFEPTESLSFLPF